MPYLLYLLRARYELTNHKPGDGGRGDEEERGEWEKRKKKTDNELPTYLLRYYFSYWGELRIQRTHHLTNPGGELPIDIAFQVVGGRVLTALPSMSSG